MSHHRIIATSSFCAIVTLILAMGTAAFAGTFSTDVESVDKELIVDGSVVHDVGRLHLNVTNWGLLGSHYSAETTYSDAPSGRWPGADGIDYLWGAGLWVAGIQLGERRVSTGQHATEIRASDEPEDVIYGLSWDAPQASRYPFDFPDDDGDGAEDEDPPNGRDDDLDGSVDEDGAGASDQHFRAEMDDTRAADIFPDHVPMQLAIVQNSFQWADDDLADFVGVEYSIRNTGDTSITDLYLGMFSDFDIDDPPGAGGEAMDDLVGFAAETVEAYPGQWVEVEVAYAHEGVGATSSGYMGWLPVGHPVDAGGIAAPAEVGVRGFQRFTGQAPFDDGGDPVNDGQRYEAISSDTIDSDGDVPDDYRTLISVGPFAALAPGEELSCAFVLVAGADRDEMLRNAGRARLVFEGLAFDRDGNPDNGDEFVVRWLGPEAMAVPILDDDIDEETPTIVRDLRLDAAPNPFNPTLEITATLTSAGRASASIYDARGRKVRVLGDTMAEAGTTTWTWDGRNQSGRAVASGVYMVRLETENRVAWRAVTLAR